MHFIVHKVHTKSEVSCPLPSDSLPSPLPPQQPSLLGVFLFRNMTQREWMASEGLASLLTRKREHMSELPTTGK